MENNMLTIARVKELALKNYNKGGDTIIECFENKEIQELIDRGVNTEAKLLEMFHEQYEIDEEYRKAAKWYAYGTTEDEEIAEVLGKKTPTENKNKCKDCYMYFRNTYDLCTLAEMEKVDGESEACEKFVQAHDREGSDPCYGCLRMDGGYNCKHCIHGDDGNYSIYDVYRPSELL